MSRHPIRWRIPLAALALILLITLVAAVVRATSSNAGINLANLVAVVISVVTTAVSLTAWASRRQPSAGGSVGADASEAADVLAMLVKQQWWEEARRRALNAPAPIPVRWQLVTRKAAISDSQVIVDGVSLSGCGDDIADCFRALSQRRLVIIGGAGMGKTTLAMRLLLELLVARAAAVDGEVVPVPVLLSIADWDPRTHPRLQDWLADRLARDYPALKAPEFGPDAAAALVRGGRILPILDGLDEIREADRPRVLAALDASLSMRDQFVLTSRTAEFEAATAASGRPLRGAVVIASAPLALRQVVDYLRIYLPVRLSPAWAKVLDALETNPQGPLAQALTSPFALSLLTQVYSERNADPSELCDSERFPSSVVIGDHLIDRLLSSPLAPGDRRAGDAEKYLDFLALLTHSARTPDLSWWILPELLPHRRAAAVCLLSGGIGLGALIIYFFEPAAGILVGCAFSALGLTMLTAPHTPLTLWSPLISWMVLRRAVELGRGRVVQAIIFPSAGALLGVLSAVLIPAGPIWMYALSGAGAGLLISTGWALVLALAVSQASQPMASPRESLRHDWTVALARAVVLASVTGGTCAATTWVIGWAAWPVIGFVSACTAAWLCLALSAAFAYHPARLFFALRGRLPFGLMRFLEKASRQGILRQVGLVYQFRDVLMQQRLQASYIAKAREAQAVMRGAPLSDRRVLKDIVEEVLSLPDVRVRIGYDSDGSRTQIMRETAMQLISTNLVAVQDASKLGYERYQLSRQRLRQTVSGPLWSRFALVYGVLAWQLPLVAFWAAIPLISRGFPLVSVLLIAGPVVQAVCLNVAHRFGGTWAPRRWIVPVAYALVPAGLLGWYVPLTVNERPIFNVCVITCALALVLWLLSRPHRDMRERLTSSNPLDWDVEPNYAQRQLTAARQAYRDWVGDAARDGLMPLLRRQLGPVPNASTTVLPEIDRAQLGDVNRADQLVDTRASREVADLFKHRASASIGISGPRGAGKSTFLRRWCTPHFGSSGEDLRLLMSAPTVYDRQEFLIHLFTKVCEQVVAERMPRSPIRRRLTGAIPLAVTLAGLIVIVTGLAWTMLQPYVQGILRTPPQDVALAVGAAAVLGGLASAAYVGRRSLRREQGSPEQVAIAHLRALRWRQAMTQTKDGKLALPGGFALGRTTSVQRTEAVLTYPQLVADFRELLDLIGLERRAVGGRVIIGIDELDKIGSAEDADRFLNDLKAVFGVPGCYFMVALSDDALVTFERRGLAVRNTFDSSFDKIFAVQFLNVGESYDLLRQRGVPLPDRFVWLCHALSSGLARDLLRRVDDLAVAAQAGGGSNRLTDLARKLIGQDTTSVLNAQLRMIAAVDSHEAPLLTSWLAPLPNDTTADCLEDLIRRSPQAEHDACHKLIAQTRAYLYCSATLLRLLADDDGKIQNWLDTYPNPLHPIDQLSRARSLLAGDPAQAWRLVDRLRAEMDAL